MGETVDRERLILTGVKYLEESLEYCISNIKHYAHSLTDEDGYLGHWQSQERDFENLRKAVDNYRTVKRMYQEYGFVLEGYDDSVAQITLKLNSVPI